MTSGRVVRERVAAASFDPVGIGALEDLETIEGLGDVVDPMSGYGFAVGLAATTGHKTWRNETV